MMGFFSLAFNFCSNNNGCVERMAQIVLALKLLFMVLTEAVPVERRVSASACPNGIVLDKAALFSDH